MFAALCYRLNQNKHLLEITVWRRNLYRSDWNKIGALEWVSKKENLVTDHVCMHTHAPRENPCGDRSYITKKPRSHQALRFCREHGTAHI